ncbi:MAG: DUF6252 family protein [Bacteroidota bacterium]
MKTKFILFFALVFTGLMSTSCSKDADTTPEPAPVTAEHYFTCELDGDMYHSEGAYAYAVDFDGELNIYGVTGVDFEDAIYIQVPSNVTVGTHSFNDEYFAYVVIGETAQSTRLEGGSGSVTIDAFDGKTIKGSFAFVAVDFDDASVKREVKEGTFQVDIND